MQCKTESLSRRWLLLGVFSLIGSGVPALMLVAARTGGVGGEAFTQLFHKALVVHVDLSVLVWFLAIACMVWSKEAARSRSFLRVPYLEESAWWAMALGALVLTLSPLAPQGEAMMSNYIPVISNPAFFFGLSLILTATLLMTVQVLLKRPRFESLHGADYAMSFGGWTAAVITLIALFAFAWAWKLMPGVIVGEQYYDLLFWAGGHVLQFTHTQMLLIAWAALLAAVVPQARISTRMLSALLSAGLLAALLSPLPFLRHEVTSQEFRLFFTGQMIWLNGLAPGAMGLFVAYWLVKAKAEPEARALKSALVMSLLVFAYGGALGFLIEGQNVIIPAHYHGSIVGITIAFMGLCYAWLPEMGGRAAQSRAAFWQPIVLGAGQIMHVTGLAVLGGHGVARKTPDAAAAFSASEIAVHVMRLGGGLAVLGGVMFVVIVLRRLGKNPSA